MKTRWVWVHRDRVTFHVTRIFKSKHAAFAAGGEPTQSPYVDAVASVRHQTFVRSGGYCELCGSVITEQASEMHERKHRGKGGIISLENSVLICVQCHKGQHHNRRPRFGEK